MGLFGGLAAFSGTGASTLNGDELATISAASRSLAGMVELARHIDGHFLPYYLFMHFWMKAGSAELWLRLPSAVAIGVAAWLLADLGRRLHSTRAGVVAAGLFAILPSVSYYGAFARSYAFAAAAVVFAFWALHRALERPSGRRWAAYGVAVTLVCCTHLFAVLVLPAHALLVRREVLGRMAAALAVGCVPAAVLGLIGYGERHAISWIPQRGPEVLLTFPKMAAEAEVLGVALFAIALAGAVLLWRANGVRAWAAAVAGWLVLPPMLLLAVSWLVTPVYVDRYLFVTAPRAGAARRAGGGEPAAIAGGGRGGGRGAGLPGRAARACGRTRGERADGEHPLGAAGDQGRAGRRHRLRAEPAACRLRLLRRLAHAGGRPALGGDAPDPEGFGYPEQSDVAAALAGHERVWVVWRGTKDSGLKEDGLPRVEEVRRAGYELETAKHSADLPGLTVALFTRADRPTRASRRSATKTPTQGTERRRRQAQEPGGRSR
ncbi:glycosyltransferase family 39 protein [Nonomuraea salmonea]|uniref:glycosyltransferase family 39 protein n=1 Tax=Nonomuraea salmonea TaxID=46181 RepID=UPI002FEA024B